MSFEGSYQVLCERGHLNILDVYDGVPDTCPDEGCSCKIVWSNLVDETNEEVVGTVWLEVEYEAVFETCKCCGHKKIVDDIRYKIPNT